MPSGEGALQPGDLGVGFVIAFVGDLVRAEFQARSERKVAALLIYGELTSNLAAVSALRKFGVWSLRAGPPLRVGGLTAARCSSEATRSGSADW